MAVKSSVTLTVHMFGPFEAWLAAKQLAPQAWGRPKTLQLLKVLLTDPGRTFTQDQLIDALFPDLAFDRAVNNLQGRVSELRKALESDLERGNESSFILRSRNGYSFNNESSFWLDLVEFERHLVDARQAEQQGDWDQAYQKYDQALDLYRGDFLEDDPYEEWVLAHRDRWRSQSLSVMDHSAECKARQGQFHQAIETCDRAIQAEPGRESAYYQKMLYAYLAGSPGDAERVFHTCERALDEALGVGPSERTVSLHDQILGGDVLGLDDVYPRPLSPDLLGRVPLFNGLDDRELQALIETGVERNYPTGTTIVRQGDVGDTFYLILDGQVEIKLKTVKPIKLGRGQFFGEMSLFDEWPRTADVLALVCTRCMVLHREDLTSLLLAKPQLALKFLRELTHRLRAADHELSE